MKSDGEEEGLGEENGDWGKWGDWGRRGMGRGETRRLWKWIDSSWIGLGANEY